MSKIDSVKRDSLKIVVLYSKPGTSTSTDIAETDDDSMHSVEEICDGLLKLGHEIKKIGIGRDEITTVANLDCDLVFNLVDWSGRDWRLGVEVIQTLEKAGIPFTGSRSAGYMISSDKVLMKKEMVKNGIPTPKYLVSEKGNQILNVPFDYPAIVKPAYEHCAIGVNQKNYVENVDELNNQITELYKLYEQPLLVEEFIEGDESHVTLIEKEGEPYAMEPAVFRFEKKDGYHSMMTYEAKWNENSWEADMNDWVEVDEQLKSKLKNVAVEAYKYLGGRGYPRVDIRIKGSDVYVLEINNNPGLGWDDDSGVTYSAKKEGMSFLDLLKNIVDNSL